MHSQAVLLALAGTAAATLGPSHLAIKREVAARQTSGADASCVAEFQSLYSSLPTPPPAYVSYVEAHITADPCSLTLPSSIDALLSSYETQVLSWAGAHSADLMSVASACPEVVASLTAGTDGAGCTDAAGSGSGTSGSGSSGSSDASSTGSSSAQQTSGSSSSSGSDSGSGSSSSSASGSGSGSGSSSSASAASSNVGSSTASAGGSSASAKATTSSKNAGPRETGFAGAALAAVGFLGVVAAL